MRFKEKKTGKVVEAKDKAMIRAYEHNSDYEVMIEKTTKKIKEMDVE